MTLQAKSKVCVGVISGAHGVRGEVKVRAFTEAPEGLTAYGPLEDKAGNRTLDLKIVRVTQKLVIARINGVNDRDAAEALRGVELYVSRDQLPDANDETWYYSDLEGLAAYGSDGELVGRVASVQNYGAGDLLEIAPVGGGESLLVLFTRENVPDVDVKAGRILLSSMPEGSLDGSI
jgi:16S rRNA processing protein RimM